MGTPACGQAAISPRCLRVPHSMDIRTEPPHSPPTPMPCTIRSRVSRIGAQMPMEAKVGRHPMSTVAPPMSSSVTISEYLRPIRSP